MRQGFIGSPSSDTRGPRPRRGLRAATAQAGSATIRAEVTDLGSSSRHLALVVVQAARAHLTKLRDGAVLAGVLPEAQVGPAQPGELGAAQAGAAGEHDDRLEDMALEGRQVLGRLPGVSTSGLRSLRTFGTSTARSGLSRRRQRTATFRAAFSTR